MRVLLITQARVSSTRLAAKVLLPLGSTTVLGLHLQRLRICTQITDFCIATTREEGADQILAIAEANRFGGYQGDVNDVLDRFYQAARSAARVNPDVVVRVTSDCPLIDPAVVDEVVRKFLKSGVDYASNCLFPTYPDGMDTEVFSFAALERAWKDARLTSEREHVTPYIWKNSDLKGGTTFKALSVVHEPDWSRFRLTLDQAEDYEVIKKLVDELGSQATLDQYVEYLMQHQGVWQTNSFIGTNEGYQKSLRADSEPVKQPQ